jgi:hypothetical protein
MKRWLVVVALTGCGSLIPGTSGPSCAVDSKGGCSCTVGNMLSTFQCDESTIANTVCCATTGWPKSGSCACDPAPLPVCTQHADGGCECFNGNDAGPTDTVVSVCQSTLSGCCIDSNNRCHCDASCSGSAMPTGNCGATPLASCGSNVHLMSCSQ